MPKRLITEMSRRRVFRGAGIYVLVAWTALQVVNAVADPYDPIRRLAVLLAIGLFPLAVVFSWAFRVLPGVIERETHGEQHPPRTALGRLVDLVAIAGVAVVIVVEAARRLT